MKSPNFLGDYFYKSSIKYPNLTALEIGEQAYTYQQLKQKALAISETIDRFSFGEQRVAIWASRSITAYSGILGVLASARAYVPLNPKFPIERNSEILALAKTQTIIVDEHAFPKLENFLVVAANKRLVIIGPEIPSFGHLVRAFPDHLFLSQLELKADNGYVPKIPKSEEEVAYLLFTSGTTGRPKGVPIRHRNVTAYLNYTIEKYRANENERFSQMFDLTFDLSVHDLFVCWGNGATLCVPSDAELIAPAQFIREKKISFWFSVPSVANFMMKFRMLKQNVFPSLKVSLFCGEALRSDLAEGWLNAAPHSILENLYGPTEATIAITSYRWKKGKSIGECLNGIVSLGNVFSNNFFCILDENGEVVDKGQVGELCLSGIQLSEGYWNEPDKTNETFFSRFQKVWYKTGDLVCENIETGHLQFLGRKDTQVKIRGFRVELGEIESCIRKFSNFQQVAAIAWPYKNGTADHIYAFVEAPLHDSQALEKEILVACRSKLMEYMIPHKIYVLPEFPLNSNGKIDRNALANLVEKKRDL